MKKRIIVLLIIAFLLIGTGATGSIYYYQKGQKEIKTTTNKTFTNTDEKNQDSLEVNLSGNTEILITNSKDNKFHLNKTSYFSNSSVSWKTTEGEGKTKITIDYNTSKRKEREIFFDFWSPQSDYIVVSVPKNVGTISITSKATFIRVTDLKTTNLTVKSANEDIYINSVTMKNLTINSKYGNLNITDATIEENLAFNTSQGSTYVSSTSATSLKGESKHGDILFDNVTADTTLLNESGDISIDAFYGSLIATNQSGDISFLSNKLKDNISLSTHSGDISVQTRTFPKNMAVKAFSKSGNISILDKERESYQTKSEKFLMNLKSKSGDIQVKED